MHKPNHKYLQATISKTNPYLEYLSKFPQLCPSSLTLSQLNDGLLLLDLLRLISDMHIEGQIQDNPRNFFHRFSNLKVLFHSIETFWQKILGNSIEGQQIDLVLIAHTCNLPQIEKLLQLFIKTAAQADNKWLFIEKILETSQQTQQYLKRIIETVISNDSKQSPRKEKEKRMYDKILELDHENDKLQLILQQLCDEKQQLEHKLKLLQSRLEDRHREIDRLQNIVDEDLYTPQKKKVTGVPDTIDRKDNQIESLKLHILEITTAHEKELQQCLNEIEKMAHKTAEIDSITQELENCKQTIDNNKQTLADCHKTINTLKGELMTKDNMLIVLKQRLQKAELKLLEMDKAEMHYKSQLQRRNLQLAELTSKLDYHEHRLSPDRSNSPHTLYLQFPAIANTETDVYIETNRTLREELERTRRQLEDSQTQLTQHRHSLDLLKNTQQENRKLREIVIDLQSHRGEEIDILVGSLHYLRNILPSHVKHKPVLKQRNGLARNLFSK